MKLVLLLCLSLLGLRAFGTHLAGGYMRSQPVAGSALTQQITVVLYLNEGPAASDANSLIVCFGDGSSGQANRVSRRPIGSDNLLSQNEYQLTHTYAGPGTYVLSTALANRSNVLNVENGLSLPMVLTTTLVVNSAFINQSPTFSVPETNFRVGVNQRVTLPLGATDPDGDSLVYGLALPLTTTGTGADPCGLLPVSVSSYQFPNDQTRRGTFKINNRTVGLTWDAPTAQGPFSIAITVSEYRNGVLLSRTLREITLLVIDQPGVPSPLPPYEPAFVGPVASIITALPTEEGPGMRLTAFPNPVENTVSVVVQTVSASPVTMQLFDANGRLIHQLSMERLTRQHEQQIGMDDLAPGQYVIRAVVNGQSLTQKIVKK